MGSEIYRQGQVGDVHFKYKLDKSNNIVVVEILSSKGDLSHEKLADRISHTNDLSPVKMVYFVQEGEHWQMLQFTEFYNGKCRVHTKNPVDKSEVEGFL